jgi:hypothetical protein
MDNINDLMALTFANFQPSCFHITRFYRPLSMRCFVENGKVDRTIKMQKSRIWGLAVFCIYSFIIY